VASKRKPSPKPFFRRCGRKACACHGARFDEAAADHVCRLFDEVLVHVKGEWAGKPATLASWEREHFRNIFGWKRRDGTRLVRGVYWSTPRKSGKSTRGAGVGVLGLCADGEIGAEVYSAAADREQANVIFGMARQMVAMSPQLRQQLTSYKRAIVHPATASSWRLLSADAYTKHGLSPTFVDLDELHAQPNRDLYDVLKSGMGARRQPLMFMTTTAGYDRNSICWEVYDYAKKCLDGTIHDPTFYVVLYEAEPDDDWTDPEVWAKANPNLGITPKLSFLEEECAKAQETPGYQNTFRRLYLNQWTEQATRWLDMAKWDLCAGPVMEAELVGRPCWGGLDLSATIDVTALVWVFPEQDDDGVETGVYSLLPRFWIPEETILNRSRRDKVPYDVWSREGLVFTTEGNVVDYGAIRRQILEDRGRFRVMELAYDSWNSSHIVQELQEQLRTDVLVPHRQGWKSFTGPSKEFEKLVVSTKLRHGGNPVLRWMASNVAAKGDEAGNIKPDKKRSFEKIDGIVAAIMGLGRAILKAGQGASVYEQRGVIAL